jgi:peptidoglycan/xylan/chitin deacetylase (PgdA/CDA1 family)
VIPRPAQYLLRFDDLCPTISAARWQEYRKLVEEFGVRPILAVVPDNMDADLFHSPPDSQFWTGLKEMETAGAVIAVHGLKHLCSSSGRSLLNLHRSTEFAGIDFKTQRNWIRDGFDILRRAGLNPRLWVAPRHGFDRNTMRALHDLGVEYISDGFARVPHCRLGVTWIPQQLWSPVAKPKGLWTICIHPWAASRSDLRRLRRFLEKHAAQFTCFDRVIHEFSPQRLDLREKIYEQIALWRVQRRYRRHRRERSRYGPGDGLR